MQKKIFFGQISSSYDKILGQKLFRTREFPRSGSKAKYGEKRGERERKKERLNDGNNNDQAMHGARNPPGPILFQINIDNVQIEPKIYLCER